MIVIKGIGLDIVEMERIRKISTSQPKFVERILTERELNLYGMLSGNRQLEYLAGRFAAKEALSKALGTGIGKEVGFHDIEVINDERGKPMISKPFSQGVHLSITHTKEYAAAQIIIEE